MSTDPSIHKASVRDYVPKILLHVFDNESSTNTLGFLVFFTATAGLFAKAIDGKTHIIDADTWLLCVAIATILVGGKLAATSVLEAIALRLRSVTPPPPPAAAAEPTPKAAA